MEWWEEESDGTETKIKSQMISAENKSSHLSTTKYTTEHSAAVLYMGRDNSTEFVLQFLGK